MITLELQPVNLERVQVKPSAISVEPGPEPTAPRRYFALDSLRAFMMLLGIYLHAVVGYSKEGGWPYKDPNPTSVYDFTLGYIHAFRMPLFYVMAGFFAALLFYRRGLKGMLANRLQRILIPFVAGWAVMFPVVIAMATFARVMDQPNPWTRVYQVIASGEFLRYLHPLHLWFLEYLILLYGVATAAVLLLPKVLPQQARFALNQLFRRLLRCRWKALILALPMYGILCLTRGGYLEDPPGFVPVFRILLPYIFTFGFGWLLYRNADLLEEMKAYAGTQLVATLGILVFFQAIGGWLAQHRAAAPFVLAGGVSTGMWLMICGFTGVFLRYLDRPMPRMRYLADSSYWLYLVHMPGLMVFQILLRPVPWPAALKVWLVLLLSIPVMLLSYHYWVRSTIIGQTLNGRRYERGDK